MTREYWANMGLCFILGALVIFAVTRAGSALTPKGLFVGEPEPSPLAEKMMNYVVLADFQIGKGKNNIFDAEFFIQNKTAHNVKNINVVCDFLGRDGMYVDRETWVLTETVPASHSAKISSVSRRYINTNTSDSSCSITDFEVVRKPAFTLERHVGGGHGKASTSGHDAAPSAGH